LEGQVLIDGEDLKTLNLRSFRKHVGYVGQEPVLFNTTIKENILMGNPDATDD
jgi:ABC-type multidrug transport system fused ATPase/permease subunit